MPVDAGELHLWIILDSFERVVESNQTLYIHIDVINRIYISYIHRFIWSFRSLYRYALVYFNCSLDYFRCSCIPLQCPGQYTSERD